MGIRFQKAEVVGTGRRSQLRLVLNFALGKRDQATTDIFIEGLRLATSDKWFQMTTDGFSPYVTAIDTTVV